MMFICQGYCKFKSIYISPSPRSRVGLEKDEQMVSNAFVVDEAAQAYNIYLIIYVCVGTRKADARDYTESSLKTQDLTSF